MQNQEKKSVRPPRLKPGDTKDETGHNPNGFTFWLAGGDLVVAHAGLKEEMHVRPRPRIRNAFGQ